MTLLAADASSCFLPTGKILMAGCELDLDTGSVFRTDNCTSFLVNIDSGIFKLDASVLVILPRAVFGSTFDAIKFSLRFGGVFRFG